MSDAEIKKAMDTVSETQIGLVRALVKAVLAEFDAPRATLTGITHRPARTNKRGDVIPEQLLVHRLRERRVGGKDTTVLLLDGTGDPTLNSKVFGPVEHHRFAIERLGRVTGTDGKKSYSRQSITGRDR